MYFCKELNTEFKDLNEMFKQLKINKDQIIALKKAQIFKSCEKGLAVTAKPLDYLKFGSKNKELNIDSDFYYIAVNTTRILDSHIDYHADGIWNKTVKEQQGKNYLVADHQLQLDKTIVRKEHVEMFVALIPFSMLGKSYAGETEALIYKVRKDKVINQTAKQWLDSGDSIEASVRMQYIDIALAVKSDDPDDKKERKIYDDYIDLIANKDEFENEIAYFWVVKQARNVMESSLVIFGSNDVTGQLTLNNKSQPDNSTDSQPPKGTIDYDKLLKGIDQL